MFCHSSKSGLLSFAGVMIVAFFVLGAIGLGLPGKACSAGTVTLSWSANPEPDIAGYKVHYGTTQGTYMTHLNVGNYTGCVVSGLSAGKTYYFVATAYDKYGVESSYSTILTYAVAKAAVSTTTTTTTTNSNSRTTTTTNSNSRTTTTTNANSRTNTTTLASNR